MKKALLLLAAVALSVSTFAVDGTITFNNRGLTDSGGNLYDALIFRPDGVTGAGDGFTAGLFFAGAADNATPIATALFRPSSGTKPGGFATASVTDVAIPGVSPAQTASLIVRAWDTASGSFANAQIRGQSAAFTTLGLGGPNPDPNLPAIPPPGMGPNFQGFTMVVVPEPSTIALGALGIGALLLRRRK